MKKYLLYLLLCIVVLTSGCFNGNSQKGLLQGNVFIGPISPVEMPGQETGINCGVYQSRKIMVYNKEGSQLIKQVDIYCDFKENRAYYQVWLEPESYLIDINHLGVDFSADVPVIVEIIAGNTLKLDIDIDTGIR